MHSYLNLFDFKQRVDYKNEILSGLTVALALIPEAVAFALIAGLSPLTGLYAAFVMGLVTSILGGRPGMISGATGAVAVVLVSLVLGAWCRVHICDRYTGGADANWGGVAAAGEIYPAGSATRYVWVCQRTGHRYFPLADGAVQNGRCNRVPCTGWLAHLWLPCWGWLF